MPPDRPRRRVSHAVPCRPWRGSSGCVCARRSVSVVHWPTCRWEVEQCGDASGGALRAGPLGRMCYLPVPPARSSVGPETLYGRLLIAIGGNAATELWTKLGAEDWLVKTISRRVVAQMLVGVGQSSATSFHLCSHRRTNGGSVLSNHVAEGVPRFQSVSSRLVEPTHHHEKPLPGTSRPWLCFFLPKTDGGVLEEASGYSSSNAEPRPKFVISIGRSKSRSSSLAGIAWADRAREIFFPPDDE